MLKIREWHLWSDGSDDDFIECPGLDKLGCEKIEHPFEAIFFQNANKVFFTTKLAIRGPCGGVIVRS